ncbi:ABC transporter substrate binding protein [Candidatus Methylocalor cossyra]|uniref:ABC transport system substrate-binding protein n=1 Tax=Candidatus Methylocalor cossyra TaxID=3108543 RepID=A0ABP1CB29_9GAMM
MSSPVTARRPSKPGLLLVLCLLLLSTALASRAELSSVAVLYPNIREPYQSVFLQIVTGIEERLAVPVKRYPIMADGDGWSALEQRLAKDNPRGIIALGRLGFEAAEKFAGRWPVIVGAVMPNPGQTTRGLSGITLAPDPASLFQWLVKLTPTVKRVTVIYNRRIGLDAMEHAQKAASLQGLTLNALPAENLREAAGLYRDFLEGSSLDARDSLWLLQDASIFDENALLPVILKEAWDKNLVVFSSTPEHVKKGALFSLYPDNFGLGRSLAALALEQFQDGRQRAGRLLPLRDLLIAVNLRTAEHLGLRFSGHERRQFDLVFPSP